MKVYLFLAFYSRVVEWITLNLSFSMFNTFNGIFGVSTVPALGYNKWRYEKSRISGTIGSFRGNIGRRSFRDTTPALDDTADSAQGKSAGFPGIYEAGV
jgi:hypothetical protein